VEGSQYIRKRSEYFTERVNTTSEEARTLCLPGETFSRCPEREDIVKSGGPLPMPHHTKREGPELVNVNGKKEDRPCRRSLTESGGEHNTVPTIFKDGINGKPLRLNWPLRGGGGKEITNKKATEENTL